MDIHISLKAEEIMNIAGLPITNSMVTGLLATIVVAMTIIAASRIMKVQPGNRFVGMVDAVSEYITDLIEQITHSRAKAIKFFPLITTFFLFILVNNWLGLLPGVGSITITTPHGMVPVFRSLAADLNATLSLAIISVVITHLYAVRELGVVSHLKKYVSLNPILLFIGLLEFISDISKIMSFSFRLFGNIFAGEVLLIVIGYLLPLAAPLPFFFLEVFVGLVQAAVFTMLTLVFLEIATSPHGEGSHQPAPSAA